MDRRFLFKAMLGLPVFVAGSALARPLPYLEKDLREYINSGMRHAIENALTNQLFKINDEETRIKVASMVDAFALHLKENNFIDHYEVICDETNNPPDYIDSNRLEVYASLRDVNGDLIYMIIGTIGSLGIDVKTIEYWKRS